ncbi:hypothetical protein N752_18285 [Desulforamulus aquiferis]|nr:hypothetical protein [Desulforamulus aquiferis]RYD03697.1 hypothetical protein N752_18285 [Desulforamulus aquiferis]
MSLKDVFGKWKKAKSKKPEQQKDLNYNQQTCLSGNLEKDKQTIFTGLGGSIDIIRREILVGDRKATIIYIEGIVNADLIEHEIIRKIQQLDFFLRLNHHWSIFLRRYSLTATQLLSPR